MLASVAEELARVARLVEGLEAAGRGNGRREPLAALRRGVEEASVSLDWVVRERLTPQQQGRVAELRERVDALRRHLRHPQGSEA